MVQKKVCIITSDNGWGLTQDTKIIKSILESKQYFKVDVKSHTDTAIRGKYDLNIHDEIVASRLYNQARINVLTPHQEWFHPGWINSRRRFNAVLCKTKHAQQIFSQKGFKDVRYTGYTTNNRFNGLPFTDKKHEFLHIAGNSRFKNTAAVIDVWRKNPKLPTLHLFNAYEDLKIDLPNVHYTYGKVPVATIKQYQNDMLYHIQPSAAEGYGHIIWEGMSTGALMITLAAPPMNESHNTFKSPAVQYDVHAWGLLFKPTNLASTVDHVLGLQDLAKLSMLARGEFVAADIQFKKLFYNTIKELVR